MSEIYMGETTPELNPPEQGVKREQLNLLDLILVLVNHRQLIFGMMFFFGFLGLNNSFFMINTYRSEATIVPKGEKQGLSSLAGLGGLGGMVAGQLGLGQRGDLNKMEMVLRSKELSFKVIEKYNLMPLLFPKPEFEKKFRLIDLVFGGDEDEKEVKPKKPKTVQDGFKAMKMNVFVLVDKKSRSVKITCEHQNPEVAKKLVDYFLTELSETLREKVMHDASENIRFFNKQIEQTSDPLLKEKLYAMLAKEIEQQVFAKAQKYFSFEIIDPPIVSDMNKKVRPRRGKYCVVMVFVGFLFAVFISYFIEFLRYIQRKEPKRYNKIIEGLKFWKRAPRPSLTR